ncbi:hypothetical protein FRB91_009217 [Serendipita sp. 411]|nr:hypothetical protein FRB91_009217 [Serendipita sp. 411]
MAPTSKDSLTVIDNRNGKQYEIPISVTQHDTSIPASAFKDIVHVRSTTIREKDGKGVKQQQEKQGLRITDRGFLNTAVIQSNITFIDGDKGILRYRGYPIEQLAEKSSFLETAYLLIWGELPTKNQFQRFHSEVMNHSTMHIDAEEIFRSFRYDAHPMSILTSVFAALGSYYPEANPSLQGQNLFTQKDLASIQNMDKQIYRLIGKAPTLAAMAYRVRQGRHFITPPPGLSYTGSFLYQMDCLGQQEYKPNPVLERALDILFLLHADHELNASTTTVLQAASSLTDPYSAIATGCASLYGPLHGGANEAVIRMLISIGTPDKVPEFLEKVKRREKMLSGFGHRVYKTTDPRSYIIRKTADEVFKVTGKDPLVETAMRLHDLALKDEYFVKRNLYPNVDFWRYVAMGFPLDFFPVLFAVPRVVGWVAHWRQMMLSPEGVKIWRPRQIYLGPGERDYQPIDLRQAGESDGQDPTSAPTAVFHSGQSKRTHLATFIGKAKL